MENKSQIAFISIRLESPTDDSICVGLIFISADGNKVFISEEKMKLVKAIVKPHLFNFFKSGIEGYSKRSQDITPEFIDIQHRYQNGIIKISSLKPIALPSENYTIEDFFQKKLCKTEMFKIRKPKKNQNDPRTT